MKTNFVSKYNYEELRAAAVSPNATQIDIDTLGEWFDCYGMDSWNGEYFDADNGLRLFPIYEEDEDENFTVIGYEFR